MRICAECDVLKEGTAMQKLDVNSAVPLYEQLKMALRERIESQIFEPGERMLSEVELCDKYGVSRITVRRAVDELVEEGYLERRQGKGTFVAQKRSFVAVMSLDRSASEGFSDRYSRRKRSVIISKREYPANSQECQWLQLEPEENVLVLTRQMLLDGNLSMIDRATYPAKRFPGLLDKIGDDTSTYEVMRKDYGVQMHKARREVTLVYATNEQSKLLGCAPGAPLFKKFKVVYDEQNIPVHISSTYISAENVVLTVEQDSFLH